MGKDAFGSTDEVGAIGVLGGDGHGHALHERCPANSWELLGAEEAGHARARLVVQDGAGQQRASEGTVAAAVPAHTPGSG